MAKLKSFAAFGVLALALPAAASQLLINGGFETGDTTGWSLLDSIGSSGFFSVTNAFATPLTGNPTVGPAGGLYYAVSDQFGPGQHALYQTFTAPLVAVPLLLSFDMFVNDWLSPQTGGSADLLAATSNPLTDPGIETFYSADTAVSNGVPNPWVHTSLYIAAPLTPGNSYMLRFLESDSAGNLNVGVDNVSLETVPEPRTLLPAGLMIGFMIFLNMLKSRRKSMNVSRVLKYVCLSAGVAFCSQAMQAQVVAYPAVPNGAVPAGFMRPHVWVSAAPAAVHGPGVTNCSSVGCYYFPADLQTAYATNYISKANGGAGMTIGIVDAWHYADAESDLHNFSTQLCTLFGAKCLPDCTSASGCFHQVNQSGGTAGGPGDAGWALEVSLDIEWAHAIAPNAHILLVEAADNSVANLFAAVQYARQHSDVVSNSYGVTESVPDIQTNYATYDTYLAGSPVPVLFSSGDSGASVAYPCTNPNVVCVGGTSLSETATSYRAAENGWVNSGGGCSALETAPSYQNGFAGVCLNNKRGVPDIAAVADPSTGAVVYLGPIPASPGSPGFYIVGGTSLAAPVTAGLIADIDASRVAAGKSKLDQSLGQKLYQGAANPLYHYRYYDVTAGNNGFSAGAGWDPVTGLGVPLSPSLAYYLVSLP